MYLTRGFHGLEENMAIINEYDDNIRAFPTSLCTYIIIRFLLIDKQFKKLTFISYIIYRHDMLMWHFHNHPEPK